MTFNFFRVSRLSRSLFRPSINQPLLRLRLLRPFESEQESDANTKRSSPHFSRARSLERTSHVPQLLRHGRHHLVAAGAAAPGARRERERREGKREAFERSQSIDDLSSSSLFLTRVFSSKKPPPIPTKNQVEYAMEAVKQGSAAVGLKVRERERRGVEREQREKEREELVVAVGHEKKSIARFFFSSTSSKPFHSLHPHLFPTTTTTTVIHPRRPRRPQARPLRARLAPAEGLQGRRPPRRRRLGPRQRRPVAAALDALAVRVAPLRL